MRACWAWLLVGCLACAGPNDDRHGRSCRADVDCDALVCGLAQGDHVADLAAMPLTCIDRRGATQPLAACEEAADCGHGLCLLAGACAAPCGTDPDCAADEWCAPVYVRTGASAFGTTHACVHRVDLPSDARVQMVERPAALSGGIDQIALPAPAGSSNLYVLEHLGDATWPVPDPTSSCRPPLCARRLSAGSDASDVLFDSQLTAAEDGPLNPVAEGSQVNPLGVLVPSGPDAPLDDQGYRLTLESKVAGDLRLTSLARDRAGGGRLDLNVYYVGADGLSVSGERGPPLLAAALDELDRIYAPAEIFLGEVRQSEVGGGLLARGTPLPEAEVSAGFAHLVSQYAVLPQLPELLALSAGASNVALDVFFVAEIDASSGGEVGGIAGGTPVPWGMHGGPGSGVVIAADALIAQNDSAKLGRTLAHEIGHALGLFHTTELDGSVLDPFPDTPSCPIGQDADHNGSLDASECADYGGDNLMFPTSDARGSQLSADQIAVLQRAFLLQ
jgi:hypothetical protein